MFVSQELVHMIQLPSHHHFQETPSNKQKETVMNLEDNTAPFAVGSVRTAALVAGLGLLAMAILAPFANFYVLQNLIVANDVKATSEHILASLGLFRIGIVSFLVVAVLDVVVAWGLHVLLEPVSKNLSMLAAWFRLIYAAVFAIALNPLFAVVQLLEGGKYLQAFETKQLQALVMLSLSAFKSAWDLGLVIFGFHLLVLGYVAFKSGFIPKWLGALLGIAAFGYLMDSFGKLLIPNYNLNISTFTFVGEFLLIFWLLWYSLKGLSKKPLVRPQTA
jgi:hypothetical protein